MTVQNFRVKAGGQYGISAEGNNITIQNNDIKGVKASGDGDLNAITAFGDGLQILYNTAIDFVVGDPGGSHTDFFQTWISTAHPDGSRDVAIRATKPPVRRTRRWTTVSPASTSASWRRGAVAVGTRVEPAS